MQSLEVGQEVFCSHLVHQKAVIEKINDDDTVDLLVALDESGNIQRREHVQYTEDLYRANFVSQPCVAHPTESQPEAPVVAGVDIAAEGGDRTVVTDGQ